MEINNVNGDRNSPWFVTNGLLVSEMVTGHVQTGDTTIESRTPNEEVLAGDPRVVNQDAPVMPPWPWCCLPEADETGQAVRTQLLRNGTFQDITPPASVSYAQYVPVNTLNIPTFFALFLNQKSLVYSAGRYSNCQLFYGWWRLAIPSVMPTGCERTLLAWRNGRWCSPLNVGF
jgi:hypothetical protein